ncbi:MAG: class I SAM-dependent methyltransferase [Desulfobacterales bacterium]|jgi:hypothetical protein
MNSIPVEIWLFIGIAGTLFAAKAIYAISIALVLPVTCGALYVSTARVRVRAFLDVIELQPGQVLVDLGCGDGRVLRAASRRCRIRAEGYELNPLAYLKARLLCLGHSRIRIHMQNFWGADLTEADVVFCYLFPDVMPRLARKLCAELKPGAVVVSCNFPLARLTPLTVLKPGNSLTNDPIFVYRMPSQAL